MNAWRTLRVASLIACVMAVMMVATAAFAIPKKRPPVRPLDLNTASSEELQQLPGVGPGIAKAIVEFREKSGPFRRIEDLLAIRGLTKGRVEKIRPYVVINGPPK